MPQLGCVEVYDVDLEQYFDTVDHGKLMKLVARRISQDFGTILLAGSAWLIFRVLAGPNVWDFQFFLSTKSPREASLAAGMWTVGYTLRWLLACAFLTLGIYYLGSEAQFDAEKIMPHVLMRLPVGLQSPSVWRFETSTTRSRTSRPGAGQ